MLGIATLRQYGMTISGCIHLNLRTDQLKIIEAATLAGLVHTKNINNFNDWKQCRAVKLVEMPGANG
jgi:hypothetical protein